MKRRWRAALLGALTLVVVFGVTCYVFYLKQQTAAMLAARKPSESVERYERIREAFNLPAGAEASSAQDWVPLSEGDPEQAELLQPLKEARAIYARLEVDAEFQKVWSTLYEDLFVGRSVSSWSAAEWERLEQFLSEHAELLGQIRAMAAASGPLYPLDLSQGYATLLPHLAPTRELTRLLQAVAIARAHGGDFEGAAADILAGLQLGARLQEEPIMLSQLVNVAINSIMFETVGIAFPEGQVPDALAAELARQYHANDLSESFLASAHGEEGFALDFMTRIMESGWGYNESFSELMDENSGMAETWGGYLYSSPLARPWQHLDMQTYGQIMDEYEATFALPYYEAREVLESIEREVDDLPFTRVLTRSLIPSVLSMHQALARTEAQQQLLLLGVALESYANEHGTYPSTLNDVQGQANGASTIDPFTGTPFHYTPEGDGFELYSVGRNLDDDGGRHDLNDGDIVWRGNSAPKSSKGNALALLN